MLARVKARRYSRSYNLKPTDIQTINAQESSTTVKHRNSFKTISFISKRPTNATSLGHVAFFKRPKLFREITGALLGVLDLRVLGFGIVFRNFSEIIEKERRMKLVKRFSQNGNEASGTSLKTSQQGSMPSASWDHRDLGIQSIV